MAGRFGQGKKKCVAYLRLDFLPLSEVFIYDEIRLLKRFDKLVLCAKRSNEGQFPLDGVYCVNSLPFWSKWQNRLSLAFFKRARYFEKVVAEKKPALLHAQFGYEGLFALHLKRKFGIPLVTSFRGFDAYRLPGKHPGIYDELFEEGDVFLPRSESMKQDLVRLGCPRKKVMVHHSSIDVKNFRLVRRKRGKGRMRILFVGRLVEKKGAVYALEALPEIIRSVGDVELRIVGDGPLRGGLEKKAASLGIADRVCFMGSLPHGKVIEEVEKAHMMLMPYVTARDGDMEGIPNVLKEALATGLPVVSTRHAGVPELIEDGRSGFLVPERDVDGLAKRSAEVLGDPALWEKFGRAGRRMVLREFNIYEQTRRLERIYLRSLG